MKHTYTHAQIEFLRTAWPLMQLEPMTRAFNQYFALDKTPSQIKAALKTHRIRCRRPPLNGVNQQQKWLFNLEQQEFIRIRYKQLTAKELHAELKQIYNTSATLNQLKYYVHNNHIDSGRTGRFEKGITPWNTNTKGLMKPNSGSFHKGHRRNDATGHTKNLGAERVCSKDGYILIKVAEKNPYTGAPTRFKHKHHVLWEKWHGPIPAGHVVAFKDGNKRNFKKRNLVLLTRAEHLVMTRQGLRKLPPELADSAVALAKLTAKTHQQKRQVKP